MTTELRVYLDDQRFAPRGWTQTETVDQTIELLKRGNVVELSLDYSLGPESGETGAGVLRWIDAQLTANPTWEPPRSIRIHSGHRTGRPMMIQMLKDLCLRMEQAGRTPPEAMR